MQLGRAKNLGCCSLVTGIVLTILCVAKFAILRPAATLALLIALLSNSTQIMANEPVASSPSKEQHSPTNDFALAMRQVKVTQGFVLKQIERQSTAKVGATLTKTTWRVDANGYPPAVLAAFESVRRVLPTCGIATLRFQRAAVNVTDFEATSTWYCYE